MNSPLLKNPPRARMFEHMTKSRFLHLEDSLDIGKIRVFAGEYKKGEGMGANTAHFIDIDDARVVLSDLSWGKPVNWTDYKGTANGEVTSRVMTVKIGKDDKVWFELKTGPGKATETGAVMPAGEATTAVSVALTRVEARRLALAVLAYIHAWEVARAVWKEWDARQAKPAPRLAEGKASS